MDGIVAMCFGPCASPAPSSSTSARRTVGGRNSRWRSDRGSRCFRARASHLLSRHHARNLLGMHRRPAPDTAFRRRHHCAAARRYARAVEHPRLRRTPDMSLYRMPSDGQLPSSISMGGPARRAGALRLRLSGLRMHVLQSLLTALPQVILVSGQTGWGTRRLCAVRIGGIEGPAHGRTMRARPLE